MKAIAIDDEPIALEIIKSHASKVPFLDLKATFTDAFKALEFSSVTLPEMAAVFCAKSGIENKMKFKIAAIFFRLFIIQFYCRNVTRKKNCLIICYIAVTK